MTTNMSWQGAGLLAKKLFLIGFEIVVKGSSLQKADEKVLDKWKAVAATMTGDKSAHMEELTCKFPAGVTCNKGLQQE